MKKFNIKKLYKYLKRFVLVDAILCAIGLLAETLTHNEAIKPFTTACLIIGVVVVLIALYIEKKDEDSDE